MKKETFYMLYVSGGKAPTIKHDTIESARTEAIRLMRLNNDEVAILQAVKVIQPVSNYEEIDLI